MKLLLQFLHLEVQVQELFCFQILFLQVTLMMESWLEPSTLM
ncbi:hypothetical protein LINPERPRIM_LOCUS22471 [Linum perenne]